MENSPYKENSRISFTVHHQSEEPSISIGICTSNDESTIHHLLKTIVKCSNNRELNIREIIIVSSGCIDKTDIIIERYIKKYPDLMNLIKESKRNGKASAINLILNIFRGDAIIFVPADVILNPNSLLLLKKKLFSSIDIGVVSGRPILYSDNSKINLIGKVEKFLWLLHNRTLGLDTNTHATGELMIIRKIVATQLPNFIINDDAFIALETIKKNYSIEYEKNALVFISVPNTVHDYIEQRKRVLQGHKQLKLLKNKNTTTFREIFRINKYLGLKLLFNELKNIQSLFYFLLAFILEVYIEINIFFSNENYLKSKAIWKRVKTINNLLQNLN